MSVYFSFFHFAGTYSGTPYWSDFTVAKIASDEPSYFGCMAKGGVDGVGTPYIVMSAVSTEVVFRTAPLDVKSIYVCNNTATYNGIVKGDNYATAFKQGDYCTLTISSYDNMGEKLKSVVVYLADYRSENPDEWKVNNKWEKVDLSELGKSYGLSFEFYSTDGYAYEEQYYMNTNCGVCIDKLQVVNNN